MEERIFSTRRETREAFNVLVGKREGKNFHDLDVDGLG
jgi:hypothetical protein